MSLDHLINADGFNSRMKKGEAILKRRLERHGFNFKRNVAKIYCETVEWRSKFLTPAEDRRQRLENLNLTIPELIEESEDQLLEAFAYFLALTPAQQQRTAQQFKDGLTHLQNLRESNRDRARRMLLKQGSR